MNDAMHGTVRHVVTVAAIVAIFFFGMAHFFPGSKPVNGPVAVSTASPVEREAQAIIEASKILAQVKGGAIPSYAQPAVTIVHDSIGGGFSSAQVYAMLGALKAKTATAVHVGSKLVGPTPAPLPSAVPGLTDAEIQAIYGADKSAVAAVLGDPNTKIATSVTITQQEVPVSRVGSLLTPGGDGIDFTVYRHKQYEVDLGAIQKAAHLAPVGCVQYLLPHTQLALGPCVTFDHGAKPGIGASIKF